jgi:hypothetical protein
MQEDFDLFDGESAVTMDSHVLNDDYNHDNRGSFSKYRAMELYSAQKDNFSLLQSSLPSYKADSSFENRKAALSPLSPISTTLRPKSERQQAPITSKCPSKPAFLALKHSFYTKEGDFSKIQEKVETVLKALCEKPDSSYDYSFLESNCMVRALFFCFVNLVLPLVSSFFRLILVLFGFSLLSLPLPLPGLSALSFFFLCLVEM